MNEKLTKQLRDEEGVVPYAYEDHLGYLTIGVGHLIDKRKGGRLSDKIINLILEEDIAEKTAEVRKALPWIDKLNEARQAVLIGMAFQMGTDGLLGFKNTLKMVEAGDWEGAAKGMLNSLWARQTPARAKRMSEQMRTGIWQWK